MNEGTMTMVAKLHQHTHGLYGATFPYLTTHAIHILKPIVSLHLYRLKPSVIVVIVVVANLAVV